MTAPGLAGGPIFIVGSMGSGTTLMRLILDSHPDIAIAQETGFMRAVLAHKWIPFWKFGGEWYGRLGLSEEDLDARLREFYDGVFGHFAQQQGKRRWGDKTPYHTWHLRQAARVFPDAVFVATVRHPGAVASSLHHRFRYSWEQSVGHWMRSNAELCHRAGALGDRLLLCRYEDLVLTPEATIRELLACLQEPWAPEVLAHHVVHSQRGTSTDVEGRTRSTDPIDPGRIAQWTRTMDASGQRLLHERAAPLAAFFGYDLDDPLAVGALLPPGSPRRSLMTGRELRQRRIAFGDRVDWSYRPAPSMANRLLQPRRVEPVRVRKRRPSHGATPKAAPAVPRRPQASSGRLATAAVRRLPSPARTRLSELLSRGAAALDG